MTVEIEPSLYQKADKVKIASWKVINYEPYKMDI